MAFLSDSTAAIWSFFFRVGDRLSPWPVRTVALVIAPFAALFVTALWWICLGCWAIGYALYATVRAFDRHA